jgi:hypothetical protein
MTSFASGPKIMLLHTDYVTSSSWLPREENITTGLPLVGKEPEAQQLAITSPKPHREARQSL